MVWMNGLFFALRSGSEHRNLTFDQLECRDNVLIYTESQSKNRQGGLLERNEKPKVVYYYADENNPDCCFIRLFKKYRSLCPSGVTSFYLTPLVKPRDDCWYCKTPVGRNTLGSTVARLCKLANIPGFKTNHSLRATAATRLYHSNVDEQLIMSVTGHKSTDGIRNYKRTSEEQYKKLSDVLRSGTIADDSKSSADCSASHGVSTDDKISNAVVVCKSQTMPLSPSLNLSGCHAVTINFNK